MMNVAEIKRWLATIDDACNVAIDEGGTCLVELNTRGDPTDAYIEIGGTPYEPEGDGEMRNYEVVGNAVYASGFDVVVRAGSADEARELVDRLVSTDQLGACMGQMDLQEVCINECNLTDEAETELDN